MDDSNPIAFVGGIVLGTALVVLGVGAYVVSGFASVTALIPVFFGIPVVILGILGHQYNRERIATYGIGLVGLVTIVGASRGIPDVVALLTGGSVDSVVATVSQGLMVVIGLLLVITVVRDVVVGQ